jgi:hypothetical protein
VRGYCSPGIQTAPPQPHPPSRAEPSEVGLGPTLRAESIQAHTAALTVCVCCLARGWQISSAVLLRPWQHWDTQPDKQRCHSPSPNHLCVQLGPCQAKGQLGPGRLVKGLENFLGPGAKPVRHPRFNFLASCSRITRTCETILGETIRAESAL